jgi:hypothetical protein
MNVESIKWPEDAVAACKLYLSFAIDVVESMEFSFPELAPNPLLAAKAYLDGKMPEEEYQLQSTPWWEYLDSSGAIREMRDPSALAARLAICLLSVTPDQVNQLGDHLSWFLDVLRFLGSDLSMPLQKMKEHFEPTRRIEV